LVKYRGVTTKVSALPLEIFDSQRPHLCSRIFIFEPHEEIPFYIVSHIQRDLAVEVTGVNRKVSTLQNSLYLLTRHPVRVIHTLTRKLGVLVIRRKNHFERKPKALIDIANEFGER
jgi:hypothetical protein